MQQFTQTKGLSNKVRRSVTAALILLALALNDAPAQAAPLNLSLQATPDIFSDFIDVSYDAANQKFTAHGFVEHMRNGNDAPIQIVNGTFEIAANITNDGSIGSGTLTVTGEVPELGSGPGTLLAGKVTLIGYGDSGSALELQFDTNGGSMASNFGSMIGIILGQSGFPGNFSGDFSSNSIAVAGIGW
jgi:hypothetical protein